MPLKLPEYYSSLDLKKKAEWDNIKSIFDNSLKEFTIKGTSSPHISDFHLINTKNKPIFYNAWKLKNNSNNFTLCLIEYETHYEEAHRYGSSIKKDTHKYFFGYLTTPIDLGQVLIRPETIADKISELINPIEIDIKGFEKFNKRYYVLANNQDKFMKGIDADLLNYLANIKNVQLEFNGNRCFFRLLKAIDKNETIKLCEIGFKFDEIFNNK